MLGYWVGTIGLQWTLSIVNKLGVMKVYKIDLIIINLEGLTVKMTEQASV